MFDIYIYIYTMTNNIQKRKALYINLCKENWFIKFENQINNYSAFQIGIYIYITDYFNQYLVNLTIIQMAHEILCGLELINFSNH